MTNGEHSHDDPSTEVGLGPGHIEWPVSQLAEALGLTVQRVNQLAAAGVVAKTRHGFCDATESIQRFACYKVEEDQRRNSRAPATSAVRDERYWRGAARDQSLRHGWTAAEVGGVATSVEGAAAAASELQRRIRSFAKTLSKAQRAGADWEAVEAVAAAIGKAMKSVEAAIAANNEQVQMHEEWLLDSQPTSAR